MTLANPGALWGLLLIPLILLLYVLRTERRRLPWSNVRLWRGLGEELEARRNWRPPRRSLLLALQLAFVAVGVLALAGPILLRPAEGEHLIVVLDASASLGANDVAPARFAAAQALALERLARLAPGDRATVIRAGAEARPLVEAVSAPLARAAVQDAAVSQAPGDLRTALLLAGAAGATPAGNPRVVVFTDGAFTAAAGGRPGWPAVAGELAAPVEYVVVGRGDANVAVTALALRRPPNGGPTAGYARVSNLGSAPAAVPARLLADNLPLQNRRLDLAPGASEELTFALPPGTRTVALQLDASDLLAADNRAEARAPASGDRAVTLVSAQPDLLARALRALPGVRVTTVAPDDYAGAALAPLVVFDGFLPRVLPAADAIVVNPPAGALEVLGEVPAPAILSYDRGHPLLDAIDPAALQISKILQLRAPAWTNPVLWSADGPALLEGTNGGRRVVILAFDPRASNLPRLRAFPLLLANALDRLGWGEREGTVATGQAVRLPPNAGRPGGGRSGWHGDGAGRRAGLRRHRARRPLRGAHRGPLDRPGGVPRQPARAGRLRRPAERPGAAGARGVDRPPAGAGAGLRRPAAARGAGDLVRRVVVVGQGELMGLSFAFPAALLLLLVLPALVWLGWPRLRYLPPVRRWTALGVRLIGAALLALALAGPAVRQPDDGRNVVFVVDVSGSVAPETEAQAFDWVRRAEAARGAHDRSAVVVVDDRATVVRPLGVDGGEGRPVAARASAGGPTWPRRCAWRAACCRPAASGAWCCSPTAGRRRGARRRNCCR